MLIRSRSSRVVQHHRLRNVHAHPPRRFVSQTSSTSPARSTARVVTTQFGHPELAMPLPTAAAANGVRPATEYLVKQDSIAGDLDLPSFLRLPGLPGSGRACHGYMPTSPWIWERTALDVRLAMLKLGRDDGYLSGTLVQPEHLWTTSGREDAIEFWQGCERQMRWNQARRGGGRLGHRLAQRSFLGRTVRPWCGKEVGLSKAGPSLISVTGALCFLLSTSVQTIADCIGSVLARNLSTS